MATAEGTAGQEIVVKVDKARPWTPDTPVLYPLSIKLTGETGDRVDSYFGMRKIALGKDEKGILRIMLNNKFVFQYGPLDQGWWPDGLYTAPTDEALKYDIEITKKLGCNMARKHVKVEPARWYYWCDKLGLLVWQDMPSKFVGGNNARAKDSAAVYEAEWPRIMAAYGNYPSIIMWVPFNEGWGQYDTPRIVEMTRKLDPTRLVNNASGGRDRGVGDVNDVHTYPGPDAPPAEEKRAIVIGEFGGLGLTLKEHKWKPEGNWDYRSFPDSKALTGAYVELLDKLRRQVVEPGLSGAVYTQTTDVEVELNGFMTYDRAVIKLDAEQAAAAARRLYRPVE
jgi:beta-galactosidase/beta-glucuronidase